MAFTRDLAGRLSPDLFWDVDQKSIDPDMHKGWLLERVLERGGIEDWEIIRSCISREDLAERAVHLRLDPKTRNFLEQYLCRF